MPPPETSSIGDIGQIAIAVHDVARAKSFYAGVLGLKPLFDAEPNLSFLAAGSVRIMLTLPEGAGKAVGNSILYFRTAAIDATYSAIIERGADPGPAPRMVARMDDHELWMGFVRDPDGNLVGLMEERR
ncbi:MAG TPA: VOC family protein [Opitutaceae bacterium]|nr:VOC family protein [Opitutaceae bacterium]